MEHHNVCWQITLLQGSNQKIAVNKNALKESVGASV